MKAASTALQNFLFSTQGFVFADLYTFTLLGGAVLRYTSADQPIVNAGLTFARGPAIKDSGIKQGLGVQVDTVDITIMADGRSVVGGVPLLDFIRGAGFDGATIKIERAFAADWPTMLGAGPVGSYIRYGGRFSQATKAGTTSVTVTMASWLELLDVYYPTDLYQASCGNTLFDSKCLLDRASYAAAGVVGAGATTLLVPSNLSAAAGTYDLGAIIFSTGPNAGFRRTVKHQDASGNLTLVAPLPATPVAGNAFTAYPGCDLQQSTCTAKFNNLIHFRGQPYIPSPETAI